jgi:hypothetical protein
VNPAWQAVVIAAHVFWGFTLGAHHVVQRRTPERRYGQTIASCWVAAMGLAVFCGCFYALMGGVLAQ